MPAHSIPRRLRVAVVGSGISGVSAAWLLGQRHDVVLFEKEDRLGGHTNTVDVPSASGVVAVDTGFIVFNHVTYPNLTALFAHLGVPTRPTDMSFSVSADEGAFEYAGSDRLRSLLAQPSNLLRPRFWRMMGDLVRFYRAAPGLLRRADAETLTLGAFLAEGGYGRPFIEDHLLPMAAAIWSAAPRAMLDHPAAAFVRFCDTHGLLKLRDRPRWHTVVGGSRRYLDALMAGFAGDVRLNTAIQRVERRRNGVILHDRRGEAEVFDHVVIAAHADQALAMLDDPGTEEIRLLSSIPYQRNVAYLHRDATLMPRRKAAWASWNYLAGRGDGTAPAGVTYWMNRLQGVPERDPLFVSLNPPRPPAEGTLLRAFPYEHPVFGLDSRAAQRVLWSLQGRRRTWLCGAWFGAGFHEDGLQAGLAVAEQLGGVRRPWTVAGESGRIHVTPVSAPGDAAEFSA